MSEESDKSIDSGIIKPINRDTVHRICSGQVVLSLAIAVKELVENAIDAGATNIEVRLKDFGSELVEVVDNGSGVLTENFQALTLKHYTSKLKEFSDLESVETLGFRGEALSSLCALSDLMITTRHVTAEYGTKIQYDHNGKVVNHSPTARPYGTTVTLTNLFCTLPVRRKEFTKNLKKEFNKMCQLLYAYCLVSTSVKLTCTHQTSKTAKTTVVSTQGLNSVRDNIISVFGSKQISSLIDIVAIVPDDTVLQEYGITLTPGEKLPFEFECFISSVMHGSGRSANDRQFYYINSRPCEPNKIMKLVNLIYKQFNEKQYPFVYMNILIEKRHVDVNVTPDKRQIFLEREKLLLATVKSSLLDAFKNFPSSYKVQNVNGVNTSLPSLNQTTKTLKRTSSEATNKVNLFESFKKKLKSDDDIVPETQTKDVVTNENIQMKQLKLINNNNFNLGVLKEATDMSTSGIVKNLDTTFEGDTLTCELTKDRKTEMTVDSKIIEQKPKTTDGSPENQTIKSESSNLNLILKDVSTTSSETVKENLNLDTTVDAKKLKTTNCSPKKVNLKRNNSVKSETSQSKCNVISVSTSIDQIKQMISTYQTNKNDDVSVRFRSEISPDSNKQAEQELQKQMKKEDFKKMDIIGQFNLGFIVARLESDLFIIDQHATDEKYNFEQLQLNTVLETQVLVSPKPLELTAGNEEVLIENEDIFKKNGFTFSIDHLAEATKKIKLTSIPLSKNVIFGKDEIDELLFMLQDANHTMCRPSRVRCMFASRACRKSVMIGDALTHPAMKKLVEHMGDIDQPWNCPHGRPTMRHLINLNLIKSQIR